MPDVPNIERCRCRWKASWRLSRPDHCATCGKPFDSESLPLLDEALADGVRPAFDDRPKRGGGFLMIGSCERVVNRVYWATNPSCTEEQVTYTRYWVHDQILVGGTLQDAEDARHVREDLGCSYVLSVESEREDVVRHAGQYARCTFPDLGVLDPGIVRDCVAFARGPLTGGDRLYVHCQMGGSRSPAIAYAILRLCFGKTVEEALAAIRASRPNFGTSRETMAYLLAIEDVTQVRWKGV